MRLREYLPPNYLTKRVPHSEWRNLQTTCRIPDHRRDKGNDRFPSGNVCFHFDGWFIEIVTEARGDGTTM